MEASKFNIEFKSNFGFVSGATVNAAIRHIKSVDPMSKERLQRGWNGQATLVYLSSGLTAENVRNELTKFIQKHDNLHFYLNKVA